MRQMAETTQATQATGATKPQALLASKKKIANRKPTRRADRLGESLAILTVNTS